MQIEQLTKKIFDLVIPYAQKLDGPISYVNIEIPDDFEFSDEQLWASFNKTTWDTLLSNSELQIKRVKSNKLKLISLSEFEDEYGVIPTEQINTIIEI